MMAWVRESHRCSTSLISSALSQMRRIGREHLFEQLGPGLNLIGQRLKIVEKLLFARNQAKTHRLHPLTALSSPAEPMNSSRSVYTAVTLPLHRAQHAGGSCLVY